MHRVGNFNIKYRFVCRLSFYCVEWLMTFFVCSVIWPAKIRALFGQMVHINRHQVYSLTVKN